MMKRARHIFVLVLIALAALLGASAVWAVSEKAQEILYEARENAGEDRHREAIDLYLRAIALDPSLRSTVAVELGHQYTWADKPDSAVIWYGRYLEDHPGDMEASLGMARALSWADDLYDAEAFYTRVLPESKKNWINVLLGLAKVMAWQEDREMAQHIYEYVLSRRPDNIEARLGLAETMNWSGRHHRARELYEGILEDDPDNTEAQKGLAESLYWMGRSDLAMDVIENAEPSSELDALAATISASKRPRAGAAYRFQKNSSDGEYHSLDVTGTIPLGYRTRVTPGYLWGFLTRQNLPDIRRDRFRVSLEHRFNETWLLTAAPGVELNRFDPLVVPPGTEPVEDFNLFVWDAYVTVTPRDWLRLDAGSSRVSMPIPVPVYHRIDVTTENIGLDWRISHRVATFWETAYSSYSDGNARFAAAHRGEWNPPIRVPYRYFNEITLIEGVEYFNFKDERTNGYFNPSEYLQPYLGLRFITDAGRRVRLNVEGRFGAEWDSGTGWASLGSFDASLRVRVAGETHLALGVYKSGSRLTSPDGFRAEGAYATLDLNW